AAHGWKPEIAEVDRLVSACSRGDRASALAMREQHPGLQIGPEHYRAFYEAAERDDVVALETMLDCGFDPDRGDESIGKTPLHIAAMEGWPRSARVLLDHGASVSVRDREFKGQPLIWAAEGSRTGREGRDHAAVGRMLLAAGSPLDWASSAEPGEEMQDIIETWRQPS